MVHAREVPSAAAAVVHPPPVVPHPHYGVGRAQPKSAVHKDMSVLEAVVVKVGVRGGGGGGGVAVKAAAPSAVRH